MRTVSTPQGEVLLKDPPVELLRSIRSFLPFGIAKYPTPQHGADFGLVMQCGKRELIAVKQQPVDCDEKQAFTTFQANNILITHSLVGYLTNGFSGLLMPCAYKRDKEDGRVETGIAYFGYPSPQGREALEHLFEQAFDEGFGHGFTTMMTGFIRALQQSSRDTRISLFQPIGLDVRYRSHLGTLFFGFLIVGPHIVCIKTDVSEKDFTWTALRTTGVTEVFHVPSIPIAIREEDLQITKPSA